MPRLPRCPTIRSTLYDFLPLVLGPTGSGSVQAGARWLMAMSCCASQLTDALSKSQRRLPRLHAFPAHLSATRVCSRIEINERFASMHMKGLPAWQYPLALPACAIERNLFPPRRISIFGIHPAQRTARVVRGSALRAGGASAPLAPGPPRASVGGASCDA